MSITWHIQALFALLSLVQALVDRPDFRADILRLRNLEANASSISARNAVPAGYGMYCRTTPLSIISAFVTPWEIAF